MKGSDMQDPKPKIGDVIHCTCYGGPKVVRTVVDGNPWVDADDPVRVLAADERRQAVEAWVLPVERCWVWGHAGGTLVERGTLIWAFDTEGRFIPASHQDVLDMWKEKGEG